MARDELRQLSESLMDKEHIGAKEAIAKVEAHVGLSSVGVRAVTGETVVSQDGKDVAREI